MSSYWLVHNRLHCLNECVEWEPPAQAHPGSTQEVSCLSRLGWFNAHLLSSQPPFNDSFNDPRVRSTAWAFCVEQRRQRDENKGSLLTARFLTTICAYGAGTSCPVDKGLIITADIPKFSWWRVTWESTQKVNTLNSLTQLSVRLSERGQSQQGCEF